MNKEDKIVLAFGLAALAFCIFTAYVYKVTSEEFIMLPTSNHIPQDKIIVYNTTLTNSTLTLEAKNVGKNSSIIQAVILKDSNGYAVETNTGLNYTIRPDETINISVEVKNQTLIEYKRFTATLITANGGCFVSAAIT